ncbi:MAG: hypothetical protein ACRDJK_02695 [Actinomycetota bacterium]
MSPEKKDDLEVRVTALESEMAEIRNRIALSGSDAAAARVLAAGADHDVSEVRAELRAHTSALNALRETQLELRETQLELRETQLEQGAQIEALDTRMREGFDSMSVGMAGITALLTRLASDE